MKIVIKRTDDEFDSRTFVDQEGFLEGVKEQIQEDLEINYPRINFSIEVTQ
jgi:hypothetical protein